MYMDKNILKNENKILINTDNFILSRTKPNHYHLETLIENNNIFFENILDFNFIKLIYEINSEYFEEVKLDIISVNEANLYLLMKPIFQNLGVLQRYVSLKIIRYKELNTIYFKGVPNINYSKLINKSKSAILSPISEITVACNIITPHKIKLNETIIYENSFVMPIFFEKIFATFLKKIFRKTVLTMESFK